MSETKRKAHEKKSNRTDQQKAEQAQQLRQLFASEERRRLLRPVEDALMKAVAAAGIGRDNKTDAKAIDIIRAVLEFLEHSPALSPVIVTSNEIDAAHEMLVAVHERAALRATKKLKWTTETGALFGGSDGHPDETEPYRKARRTREWNAALRALAEQRKASGTVDGPGSGKQAKATHFERYLIAAGQLLTHTRDVEGELEIIGPPATRAEKVADLVVDDMSKVWPGFGKQLASKRDLLIAALEFRAQVRRGPPSGSREPLAVLKRALKKKSPVDDLFRALGLPTKEATRKRTGQRIIKKGET